MKPWQLIFTGRSILKIDPFVTERKSSLVKGALLPNPLLLLDISLNGLFSRLQVIGASFPSTRQIFKIFIGLFCGGYSCLS